MEPFQPTREEMEEELTSLHEHVQQLESELTRINRALQGLSEAHHAIIHITAESHLYQEICRIVVEVGGYCLAWIGLAQQDAKKSILPVCSSGYSEGYIETTNISWNETDNRSRGPTGAAIRTGVPGICNNMLTDPRFAPWRAEALKRGYASSIALPLMAEDKPFGALNIYAASPDAFKTEEVNSLMKLAECLAYGINALHKRRMYTEAETRLAHLTYLLDHVSEAIIAVDSEFQVTSWNHAAESLYSWSAQEVMGKLIWEMLRTEFIGLRRKDALKQIKAGNHFHGEATQQSKDNSTLRIETNVIALKDELGRSVCYIAVNREMPK